MSDMDFVISEMQEAKTIGEAISRGAARRIASWFQSPGRDGIAFAKFASTGILPSRRDMEAAISRQQREDIKALGKDAKRSVEYRALSALRFYVRNPSLRVEA